MAYYKGKVKCVSLKEVTIEYNDGECDYNDMKKLMVDKALSEEDGKGWEVVDYSIIDGVKLLKCPLCDHEFLKYTYHNGVHIWSCPECPFVSMELYNYNDLEDFCDYVKGNLI